jgi:hypothetical protein
MIEARCNGPECSNAAPYPAPRAKLPDGTYWLRDSRGEYTFCCLECFRAYAASLRTLEEITAPWIANGEARRAELEAAEELAAETSP